MKPLLTLAVLAALVSGSATAQSTSTNRVTAKTDWTVFTDVNPTECWAVSPPKETVNTKDGRVVAVRRGKILLMVFSRPSEKVSEQVYFTGGYTFRKGSSVSLDIDGRSFELFVDGENAWAPSGSDDAKIVAAMKRGSKAVLSGVSERSGTVTKDTFSLLGFTAALDEVGKRCAG